MPQLVLHPDFWADTAERHKVWGSWEQRNKVLLWNSCTRETVLGLETTALETKKRDVSISPLCPQMVCKLAMVGHLGSCLF